MKLLREYIRALLLEEEESMEKKIARDDEWYGPHTFGGPHRERYSKPGTKWWTIPGGFYGGNHGDGLVTYMPNEDGTYDIKPPSDMPAKWADIAGWVYHDAYGEVKYSGIRFGQSPDGAESKGLHAGQDASTNWKGRGQEGSPADDRSVWKFWSINVLHPELWNDPSAWFVKVRELIVRLEARLKELEGEHGGKALLKKLQKFAFKASSPDSEFNNAAYGPYTTELMDNGKSEIMQSKPGRKAAEMQGLSYDVWAYLYGFLRWKRDKTPQAADAFLEFLDDFEEHATRPGPDLSDADALVRGKEIVKRLIDEFGVTKFAKIFAEVWRKLKISPREEISAFTRYSRGNRDDGTPTAQELLKKHDETTYPSGIIYEIPDEAYMALAREYS